MKTVLLPVKDFKDAKQRLTPALTAEQRANLARSMLSDVLDALSDAHEPTRIVVYTASESVCRLVRPFGFEILVEHQVSGHSAAVNTVLPRLSAASERVLIIASDLPYLRSADVDDALTADCPGIGIMPSRDGTGTNGILVTPPLSIVLDYGHGSFKRHFNSVVDSGATPVVIESAGIAFDIDTPEDLNLFAEDPRLDSETWRFLKSTR